MDDAPLGKDRLRLLLYFAQFGHCIWCGEMMQYVRKKNGSPGRDFPTFEHLTPKSEGGTMSLDNIVLVHAKCNWKRNIDHQQKKRPPKGPLLLVGS